ncbi:hypothetical protein P5V15_008444 [Pogonomyrmex californicus]
MTAHDQMRALLDQLMGTGRNGENNKFQVKYSDTKVCKSFLLACCPHEILSSTVSIIFHYNTESKHELAHRWHCAQKI